MCHCSMMIWNPLRITQEELYIGQVVVKNTVSEASSLAFHCVAPVEGPPGILCMSCLAHTLQNWSLHVFLILDNLNGFRQILCNKINFEGKKNYVKGKIFWVPCSLLWPIESEQNHLSKVKVHWRAQDLQFLVSCKPEQLIQAQGQEGHVGRRVYSEGSISQLDHLCWIYRTVHPPFFVFNFQIVSISRWQVSGITCCFLYLH